MNKELGEYITKGEGKSSHLQVGRCHNGIDGGGDKPPTMGGS